MIKSSVDPHDREKLVCWSGRLTSATALIAHQALRSWSPRGPFSRTNQRPFELGLGFSLAASVRLIATWSRWRFTCSLVQRSFRKRSSISSIVGQVSTLVGQLSTFSKVCNSYSSMAMRVGEFCWSPIMWAVRMRIKSPKHLIQMSKPELRRGDWAWRVETRCHYRSEGMKTPPFYGGNVCLEPQTKALLFICFFWWAEQIFTQKRWADRQGSGWNSLEVRKHLPAIIWAKCFRHVTRSAQSNR